MQEHPSSPSTQTAKQRYSSQPRDAQIRELRQQWNTICGAGESFLEHIEENGEAFPDNQLYPRVWVALANLVVNMLGFDSETPFRDVESVTETLNDRLAVISGRFAPEGSRELVGSR